MTTIYTGTKYRVDINPAAVEAGSEAYNYNVINLETGMIEASLDQLPGAIQVAQKLGEALDQVHRDIISEQAEALKVVSLN